MISRIKRLTRDKWKVYLLGGLIISFFYLICDVFIPKATITFFVAIGMGIWWGVPLLIVAILIAVLTPICLIRLIFGAIAEIFFTEVVEIKCRYCNGTGKIKTNLGNKIHCDDCIGQGTQYIKVWKQDIHKIRSKNGTASNF
jgi:hypothetical protein